MYYTCMLIRICYNSKQEADRLLSNPNLKPIQHKLIEQQRNLFIVEIHLLQLVKQTSQLQKTIEQLHKIDQNEQQVCYYIVHSKF